MFLLFVFKSIIVDLLEVYLSHGYLVVCLRGRSLSVMATT